jgi:hypothetical protein
MKGAEGEKTSSSALDRRQAPWTGGLRVGITPPPLISAENVTSTVVLERTPVAPADGEVDATLKSRTDTAAAGELVEEPLEDPLEEQETPLAQTIAVPPPLVRAYPAPPAATRTTRGITKIHGDVLRFLGPLLRS